MATEAKCPFAGTPAHTNRDWWPNQLDVQILHQHSTLSNPMGARTASTTGAAVRARGSSDSLR